MIVFCSTTFIKKGFLRNLLKLDPRIFIITASRKLKSFETLVWMSGTTNGYYKCNWKQTCHKIVSWKWIGKTEFLSPLGVLLVSYYSQTCSNHHIYKTTNCLRPPMLSAPKPIPIQSLLYKTTTCLMRPGTTFFCPPSEKSLSKTATAKFYSPQKWVKMHIK